MMRLEQDIDDAVIAGDDGDDVAGELEMVENILAAARIAVDDQIRLLKGPGIGNRSQERIEGFTGAVGNSQQPIFTVEITKQFVLGDLGIADNVRILKQLVQGRIFEEIDKGDPVVIKILLDRQDHLDADLHKDAHDGKIKDNLTRTAADPEDAG